MIRDLFGFRVSGHLTQSDPQISRQFDLRRIYSALIFIPLFYFLVRYGPPVLFFFLVTLVSLLALWEFYRMYFPNHDHQLAAMAGIGLLILVLAGIPWLQGTGLVSLLTVAMMGTILFLMTNVRSTSRAVSPFLVFPFGAFYIGLGLGHFLLIRNLPEGDLLVFFVILVTWTADTGAYFIGMTFGRRQLAPRLSPKKTVEGFLGGLFCAVIVACLSHFWFFPFLTLVECAIIGVLLACLGLVGDLAESFFKRSSGVKDSGTLIPGHGGMLDRLDSLLFTGPAFFYYYILFGNLQAGA